MSRPLMGYLAGAAFALTAAASAATAFAQAGPPAPAAPLAPSAFGDHQRIERRIVTRDGEGHHMDQAEHLRTMLQLKPSQEAALTAYLAGLQLQHGAQVL